MADNTEYITCDALGDCYSTRWNSWGRWVFVAFMIIGFIFFLAMLMFISARRRRRSGLRPMAGTGWLAPKNQHPTHHTMPGPPGPAGYYPPPPPGQEAYGHYGNIYTPPPYTPNPQYTGTTTNSTSTNAYYAPPPAHPIGQSYELAPHNSGNGAAYRGPGSPAPPVSSHPTGTSTHSYVQSNNPFQPPTSPPPAHVTDIHTGKN